LFLQNKKLPLILVAKPMAHFTLGVKPKVELKSSIPIVSITAISLKGFTLGEQFFLINHFMTLT
jgi:hypothetical protein